MIKSHDDPNNFLQLTEEQQNLLLSWISDNLTPIKSFNDRHTSYGLKHLFENAPNGFYVDNGSFKGAMIKSGYKVKDTNITNWHFNISEKSKCLKG